MLDRLDLQCQHPHLAALLGLGWFSIHLKGGQIAAALCLAALPEMQPFGARCPAG
jgi:hypothetical protein